MKAIVCGGRYYADKAKLEAELDTWMHADNFEIAHGNAKGADTLADIWAKSRGIKVTPFPADWARHGKSAGPKRNQRMLDEYKPNFIIAFPGGKGTADMIRRATMAGVAVHIVK